MLFNFDGKTRRSGDGSAIRMEIQMTGIVYVVSNAAMPGLVKIGQTTRENIEERMKALYSTDVPLPFECEMAFEVDTETEAKHIEKELLDEFAQDRLHMNREFIKLEHVGIDDIRDKLEDMLLSIQHKDVTHFAMVACKSIGDQEVWSAVHNWRSLFEA